MKHQGMLTQCHMLFQRKSVNKNQDKRFFAFYILIVPLTTLLTLLSGTQLASVTPIPIPAPTLFNFSTTVLISSMDVQGNSTGTISFLELSAHTYFLVSTPH